MAFELRTPVNGSMLRNFIGKTVSLFVKIESESNSSTIRVKTTDDQEVRVTLSEPISARSSDWVEIIGTPAGPDAIRAREVILFGGNQDLDVEGYNMMVQFWNHSKDIYRQG
ncbi:uncharacterized protein LOC129906731 [Episyrphus balteatus]|uniref:uncharacterized protein LOC129906731 n=1 Tax=Episyrphus balteatus TaxID=286459 RepID=UPI00248522A4|nr:uncharacterized protein LOC129906731 [Episyrphus balteatus]